MKEHLQPGHFNHIYSFMFLSVSTCMHFGMCIAFSSHSGPFRTPTVHSPPTSTCHQGRARITGCLPAQAQRVLCLHCLDCLDCLDIGFRIGFWRRHTWALARCLWLRHPTSRSSKQKNNTPRKKQGMLLPSAFLWIRPATFCTPVFQAHRFIKRWNFRIPYNLSPTKCSHYCCCHPFATAYSFVACLLCRAPKLERSTAHASGPCSCVVAQRPSFQHVRQTFHSTFDQQWRKSSVSDFRFLLLELVQDVQAFILGFFG